MTSLKSFTFHLAFLTLFLLAFIHANHAEEEETFTQEFLKENQDIVEKFTTKNPYFIKISDGTAKDSMFKQDIISLFSWYTLWTRSAGYALVNAPVPPPKDWELGDVPPEFFIDVLAGAINDEHGDLEITKNIATKHNIDLYGSPPSKFVGVDADYMIKIARDNPFGAWFAANWAGVRLSREAYLIADASAKKNGYSYAYQDHIDVFTSAGYKNTSDGLELITNLIYKSKDSDRKLATKLMRNHLDFIYNIMAEDATA
ncbi:1407_t:CDS:1 [Acaulospora morrowiae]|uniref:1407_t:CDS:1 n=1 Tax=Acaulospora morrowiae TaxID=94023 RepID=A0A9N8Z4G8_9GLOM|nr:1407_t:CDS:1 [Acaulospora morrowiae]